MIAMERPTMWLHQMFVICTERHPHTHDLFTILSSMVLTLNIKSVSKRVQGNFTTAIGKINAKRQGQQDPFLVVGVRTVTDTGTYDILEHFCLIPERVVWKGYYCGHLGKPSGQLSGNPRMVVGHVPEARARSI